MTSPPISVAVLGLGRWGEHLVRNLLAMPQTRVVAVGDPDLQRIAHIRQRLALPPEVQTFEQWEAVVALPDLQAVVVATPATTHDPIIRSALQRRLHVLSEKRMTLDTATCRDLCAQAAAQGVQLVVDHTYLFHPAVRAGQRAMAAGQVGQVRYGYASRTNLGPVRPDVNALWDLAIHDVSIFNHWLGQRPRWVAAWGQGWLQSAPTPQFPQGLDDVGWLRLGYPGPVEMMVHGSWLNPHKQRRLAVVGDRGSLVFDEMTPEHPLTFYGGQVQPSAGRFLPTALDHQPLPVPQGEPLRQVCAHFLDCIIQGQASSVSSGYTAADLVAVFQAADRSCQQGGQPVPVAYGDGDFDNGHAGDGVDA